MTNEELLNLKGKELISIFGGRPKGCNKNDEELTCSDYIKCIGDGTVGGRRMFKRIPIRRISPEDILCGTPIKDDEDLEKRIKLIVQWYRDMMPNYNILIDFGFQALTDEEMDAVIAEDESNGIEHTCYEVERKRRD